MNHCTLCLPEYNKPCLPVHNAGAEVPPEQEAGEAHYHLGIRSQPLLHAGVSAAIHTSGIGGAQI